jgi:serine/threonine-protein kinase
LGCVLYEMLSAEPPFVGATAQAIIARVMTEEPRPLTLQRRTIPPNVEAAVRRALEKLPADRFASAAEFAAALANPSFAVSGVRPVTAASLAALPARQRLPKLAPWALAAVASLLAGWALLRPAPDAPVVRYGLSLPASQTPEPTRRAVPSPDGSRLLFVGPSQVPPGYQLWLKARDQYHATPVPGTVGARFATFSPDGLWIAFIQDGRVKKIAASGGAAITLADSATPGRGIAWLEGGTIVYVQFGGLALRRVSDAGGPSTVVLAAEGRGLGFLDPSPLPDGRGVLFARCADASCSRVDLWALDLRSGEANLVVPGGAMGHYVPTGHLVYVRDDGAVFAVPFNARRRRVTGEPVAMLDSVATDAGYPLFAVSRSGTMVFRTGAAIGLAGVTHELVWVERDGRATAIDMGGPLNIDPGGGNPGWALSPDGRRLAIGLATASGGDIWVKDLPNGPLSRVTFDSVPELRPRWLAGGRAISFVAMRDSAGELRQVNADGTGGEQVLARHPDVVYEGQVSPDGQWIVTRVRGGGSQAGRNIVGFHRGDSAAVPLVAGEAFDESALALSPDGRWIAYESDETGRREVYIRPFPNTNDGRWQASTNGGFAPLWARSGRELFFVDAARQMTVVPFTPGPEPRLGERRVLFLLSDDLYLTEGDYYTPWDISPDGRRFVMARRLGSGTAARSPLVVVENWFTELRAKLERR